MNYMCCQRVQVSLPVLSLQCLIVSFIGLALLVVIFIALLETNHSWHHSQQAQLADNPKFSKTLPYIPIETDTSDESLYYGIVIDCGSSGSRVYVYFWPKHSGNSSDLLNIQQLTDSNREAVVKKVTPGLSSLEKNPMNASDHIRPLLQFAADNIPKEKHPGTPLYILATAGMRLLSSSAQRAIFDDLISDIPKEFSFVISEQNCEVITGKEEGVYAWVAINYALDKFTHGEEDHPLVVVDVPGDDPSQPPHIRRRTVGMIDMGGGSMQIAYEITKASKGELAKNLIAEVNLGCKNSDVDHSYRVYVATFLGYGANIARKRYEDMLFDRAQAANTSFQGTDQLTPISDPCLPLNLQYKAKSRKKISHYFIGTGDYLSCQNSLKILLNMTKPCQKEPCSINGIHQSEIDFHNDVFYGFSEFWYTSEDVLRIGGKYNYMKFEKAAKEYCATQWSKLEDWYTQKLYPKADKFRFRMQCFKSAWMTTVLHDGFQFPKIYKNFHSTSQINGREVHWTLGSLIHRTRYLPLRELEVHQSQSYKPPWSKSPFDYEYLLAMCILVVLAAILIHIKRLRLCGKRADMPRVPSMSYFMTDEGQVQQGVQYLQGYPLP